MQRIVRIAASCGVAAVFLALLPLVASAHEQREVAGGQYELVVGFLDEPAFVGLKNGLDLRVNRPAGASASPAAGGMAQGAEEGAPVEGLVGSLQASVAYGAETMELELEPQFGEPGAYRAIFFPTAEGDYTFRISGQIEGVAIDETFTSSPEGFSPVEAVEPYQFPKGEGALGGPTVGTTGAGSNGSPGGINGGLLLGVAALGGTAVVSLRRAGTTDGRACRMGRVRRLRFGRNGPVGSAGVCQTAHPGARGGSRSWGPCLSPARIVPPGGAVAVTVACSGPPSRSSSRCSPPWSGRWWCRGRQARTPS